MRDGKIGAGALMLQDTLLQNCISRHHVRCGGIWSNTVEMPPSGKCPMQISLCKSVQQNIKKYLFQLPDLWSLSWFACLLWLPHLSTCMSMSAMLARSQQWMTPHKEFRVGCTLTLWACRQTFETSGGRSDFVITLYLDSSISESFDLPQSSCNQGLETFLNYKWQ